MSLLYDDYLAEHIGYVNKGLHWMQDNLELNDDEKNALENAINTFNHDASKYDREEYLPYDEYFYGGNRSYQVVQDFNYAWLRHIHHNPHHWQHWVLLEDDPQTGDRFKALAMPLYYIFEMIADWWSFSWKNENLGEIFTWYDSHRDKMILHRDTRRTVEYILQKIREKVVPEEMILRRETHRIVEDILGEIREKAVPEEELTFVTNSEPIGKVVSAIETDDGLEVEIVKHSDNSDEEKPPHSGRYPYNSDNPHQYGVPEQKKFPLSDKEHVLSAIRFFNYVDPKYEKELAEAILKKIEEYGVNLGEDITVGEENKFKKYIPEKEQDSQ